MVQESYSVSILKKTGWCNLPMIVLMGRSMVKNPPANAGDSGDESLIPGLERSWRRKRQLTPVFLPGKSHGQRSLTDYSPEDHKSIGQDLVTKQQLCYHSYYIILVLYYIILLYYILYYYYISDSIILVTEWLRAKIQEYFLLPHEEERGDCQAENRKGSDENI